MKSTVFRATGMDHYMDAFEAIREENEDFALSKHDILDIYDPGDKIWKYEYVFNSVELIPEPENEYDSNAVAVYIDGKKAAHIKRGSCSQVKNLINSDDFVKVEAEIGGGPYKYIDEDDDGNIYIDEGESYIFLHLTIYNDRPGSQTDTEERSGEPSEEMTAVHETSEPKKRTALKTISLICGIILVLLSALLLLVDTVALLPLACGIIALIYGIKK